jgi:hypothetical protein
VLVLALTAMRGLAGLVRMLGTRSKPSNEISLSDSTVRKARPGAWRPIEKGRFALLVAEGPLEIAPGSAPARPYFAVQKIREYREAWGVFRDRRPELYAPIMTLDGVVRR